LQFYRQYVPPPQLFFNFLSAGMTEMSSMLSQDAKQLAGKAKGLYHQALVQKYLPWVVVVGIILLTLFIRFAFY
jgi:hypothetical protein